jgi:hypothetical protein
MPVMRIVPFIIALALASLAASADSQEAPAAWRDPSTGCSYLITPSGGMTVRLRRDGLPDCPTSSRSTGEPVSRPADEPTRAEFRDLTRAIDGLRRELERRR